MKLMKKILFLFLAAALALSCAAGHAESLQPMSAVDQEAFLAWFRNYEPDAQADWGWWSYYASYQQYVDGGSFMAYMTEDASHVAAASISWGDDLNEGNIKYIRALCEAVGDSVSDETLQQIRGAKGPDMGWEQMQELNDKEIGVSDGGKVSFRARNYGFDLYLIFSDEASASFTQDALYNLITSVRKDVLYVTLYRNGMIPMNGSYGADFTLNCEGAMKNLTLKCGLESAEEAEAFFLDGAGFLLSGEALDAAKTMISEQLPAVMAGGSTFNGHLDSNTSIIISYDAAEGAYVTFYYNIVPAEAVGFVNGMKLTRGEHMRPND